MDFTWILLNFYKVVCLFWKRNRDALISWILMVHHEAPRPCYPCCATFFQLANNRNCEASRAATNATASVASGLAPAVLNRQLACFPSKRLKIIRSMLACHRFSFLRLSESFYKRSTLWVLTWVLITNLVWKRFSDMLFEHAWTKTTAAGLMRILWGMLAE